MTYLEKVEKLREKADVSYDAAKETLDAADGDLLEALILLERQGKVIPPAGGGYYKSKKENGEKEERASENKEYHYKNRETFADLVKKFGRFCGMLIHKGNINSFEVLKDGEVKTTFSITVLVILLICFFWITLPLIIIGLFLGFRYRFRGPDLGKDYVNEAMDSVATTAESIKKSINSDK